MDGQTRMSEDEFKQMQEARMKAMQQETQRQKDSIEKALATVKRRIAVYSGKGGVGKSTVAINLAAVLASQGKRVGVLDADIDCPNVNKMMGLEGNLGMTRKDNAILMVPAKKHGLQVVSMASLPGNDADNPTIWRGPLITKALMQFLGGVDWGELDYLFIDMPPGTSDIPLTLLQYTSLDGFVIVTSPQEVSEYDARKSARMVEQLEGKVLGVVENFTGDVFGTGAGEKAAKALKVPFLGSVTLSRSIRESADKGIPAVNQDDAVKEEFALLAERIEELL